MWSAWPRAWAINLNKLVQWEYSNMVKHTRISKTNYMKVIFHLYHWVRTTQAVIKQNKSPFLKAPTWIPCNSTLQRIINKVLISATLITFPIGNQMELLWVIQWAVLFWWDSSKIQCSVRNTTDKNSWTSSRNTKRFKTKWTRYVTNKEQAHSN